MKRMKTFFKYVIWILLFMVVSNFLIEVGINSSYKDMIRRDQTAQVEISQAQSTLVNGRITGTIKTDGQEKLTGKYVKITLYSTRDNELGKRYIEINTTDANPTQDFHLYFEKNEAKSYEISIVDHKEQGELEIIPKEWKKPEIIVATMFTMLMLL